MTRIKTAEELLPNLEGLAAAKQLAVHIETTGEDPHRDRILAVYLTAGEGEILHLDCDTFLPGGAELLRQILTGDGVKVFHKAKEKLPFFMALGFCPSPLFDVALAAQLLYLPGDTGDYSLPALVDQFLGENTYFPGNEALVETQTLLPLRRALVHLLLEAGLRETAQIEFGCVRALAQMQYRGIHLHREKWMKLLETTRQERDAALENLYSFAERPVAQTTLWGGEELAGPNFDSNPFVLDLLHKNGIEASATAKRDLHSYRDHPLVVALTEYRRAAKAISNFLEPMLEMIHPVTGRLHPHYYQMIAFSGRMSCTSPNIQQIPRDKAFRECFSPPPGRKLIVADYSQIELRVTAQISKDSRMLGAYQRGDDLHLLTASYLSGKPAELVSRQERQEYKAVNLGLIYGMGPTGLRQTAEQGYGVEMGQDRATRFHRQFFETYEGVAKWHQSLKNTRNREGRTLTGRRYIFRPEAGLPERSNMPVQGTAADIIKKALWLLFDRLEGTDAFTVAAVHDEILLECAEFEAGQVADILRECMEEAANSILPDVPTPVETQIADNWAEK